MLATTGALACESAPTTTFTDTTGMTFVAFCSEDGGGCSDVEATGDVPCDDDAYLTAGAVLQVCLNDECRPVQCGQGSDCSIYQQFDTFSCTHGVCLNDHGSWDRFTVQTYCARTSPRGDDCVDRDDSPPLASPNYSDECPHDADDRRCVVYDVCGDSYGSCRAPTACD